MALLPSVPFAPKGVYIDDKLLESLFSEVTAGADPTVVAQNWIEGLAKQRRLEAGPDFTAYGGEGKTPVTRSFEHPQGGNTFDGLISNKESLTALANLLKSGPKPTPLESFRYGGANAFVEQPLSLPKGTKYAAGTLLYNKNGGTSISDGNTTYDTDFWSTSPQASGGTSPSSASPVNAYRAILLPGGREVNYDYADPAIRAAADAGQYQIKTYGATGGGKALPAAQASVVPGSVTSPVISTSSVQQGLDALLARIQKEGITDESGKVLLAPGQVNTKTGQFAPTIAAGSLQDQGGTSPLSLPGSKLDSTTADATAAGIESYIKLFTPPETDTSKTANKLLAEIKTELEGLKGRGEAQLSEEEKQGVQAKKQSLQNAKTELQTKLAEYKVIQAKYQALNADIEGKPITMASITGAQAQVNRMALAELNTKAAEIAMIQANVAGLQGDLELAQNAADRAVDLKYADVKDALDIRLKQLELVQDKLSKEEKIRADAVTAYLADQKNKLAVQVANEKDRNATLLDAMSRYPDAGITLQDTIESANRKIVANSKIYKEQIRPPVSSTNQSDNFTVSPTGIVSPSSKTVLQQLTESTNTGPEADGIYADPNLYARLRASSGMAASAFDGKYGYLVNPASKARLGIKAVEGTLDFSNL